MTLLKVPLTSEQLDAATRLHGRLVSWKATDTALDLLAKRIPEFDLTACLIKAAAVNQLYGTNVYALTRVCDHVAEVMASPGREDLVEQIAKVELDGKKRRYVSFASKFAHFFINKDSYPVFDSYALQGLRYHLAGVHFPSDSPPPYADYVRGLASLLGTTLVRSSLAIATLRRALQSPQLPSWQLARRPSGPIAYHAVAGLA